MLVTPDNAAELRHLLLGDAARLIVAIVSMAIGVGSILLHLLRRKISDRVLLWFGLLALIYGYRTLLMTESAGYFVSAGALQFQILLVTFTIGIPALLFVWGLLSKEHNWVTKSLLGINVLMALTFLFSSSNEKVVNLLGVTNNVLVVSSTLALLIYLYMIPADTVPELRSLRLVILIWGLFVLYNNLRGWLPFGRTDFEFIGFFIFLCSLGYLVAARSLRTEEALLAIRNELEIARRIQTSILPESMPRTRRLAGCRAVRAHVASGRRFLRLSCGR